MEKEQKKLSTGVVILIITLVVALVTVSTLFALELLKEDDVNKQQITGEDSELKEEEDNVIESSTKIFYLNEKEHEVEVLIEQIEEEDYTHYDDSLYDLKYTVKLNGIEIKNLELGRGDKDTETKYQLGKIKDVSNNEDYLLIKIYQYGETGSPNEIVHIVNENAQILGKVEHFGGTSFFEIDQDGEKISDCEFVINDNQIIDYCWGETANTMEKHVYTLENGEFIDTLEKVYERREFEGAGASK